MLKQRVITAIVGIAILIPCIWFDKPLPWFTILVAICALLGASEFYRLVVNSGVLPLTNFGLVWTLLFILSRDSRVLSFLDPRLNVNFLMPLLLTLAVILPLIWLLRREQAFASWAWTIAGMFYVGWLLGYMVALRGIDGGRNWVFFALFVTFASDSAAFFIGKTLGKHRLAPRISPAKTFEGCIGGVFGAIIASLLFLLPTPLKVDLGWVQVIILGFLVSIFGQLGDLVKSLFKRNMGVKDSGKLLPGHGGILDRTDSIAFAGIVVYYYVIWAIH